MFTSRDAVGPVRGSARARTGRHDAAIGFPVRAMTIRVYLQAVACRARAHSSSQPHPACHRVGQCSRAFGGSDNKSCYCVRKRAAHWLILLSRDGGMTAAQNTCRSVTISMVDTLVQVSASAISSLAAVPARHGVNVAEVARTWPH